jgi:histidinol-phosphate aminotransferase
MNDWLVEHGGPDDGLPVRWDFSTNANAVPTAPALLAALAQAERCHYPDPQYRVLRQTLAQVWACEADRIVPTAGSSEGIRRLTLCAKLAGVRTVWVPKPGYGDYRAAAQALGLAVRPYADADALVHALSSPGQGRHEADVVPLVWFNEPCNPTGASLPAAFWVSLRSVLADGLCIAALDRAYEPLRLTGTDPIPVDVAALCWQLWSPNKALGLTGVRAGCMVTPDWAAVRTASAWTRDLHALAPSWVLSAEGVSLMQAWHAPDVQAWLQLSRQTLSGWLALQQNRLAALGWTITPSVTPFFLARPAMPGPGVKPAHLRAHGIKLRDTSSMGLPGWWRLSTQPPVAQEALLEALQSASTKDHP